MRFQVTWTIVALQYGSSRNFMNELIIETTDATFDVDVLQSDLPVLLDFWAPWCGPCKAVAPLLERLATQHAARLRIVKYNVDQDKESYKRFNLRGVPTLVGFRSGAEVARCTGVGPARLKSMLDGLLQEVPSPGSEQVSAWGGDPARKARCVERVRQAIRDKQLFKPALGVRAEIRIDGGELPSTWATGGPGATEVDKLDIPAALAGLYDMFYERLPADGTDTGFALDWLEAIPVGADLGAMPRDYVHWMLHDADAGVVRHVSPDSEVAGLWGELTELSGRQAAASVDAWRSLAERSATMRKALAHGPHENVWFDQVPHTICNAISVLGPSPDKPDVTMLAALLDASVRLPVEQVRRAWWSDEEHARFNQNGKAMNERIAALGEQPAQANALAAYHKQVMNIRREMAAEGDAAYPALRERQNALNEACTRTKAAAQRAHVEYLLARLAQA